MDPGIFLWVVCVLGAVAVRVLVRSRQQAQGLLPEPKPRGLSGHSCKGCDTAIELPIEVRTCEHCNATMHEVCLAQHQLEQHGPVTTGPFR